MNTPVSAENFLKNYIRDDAHIHATRIPTGIKMYVDEKSVQIMIRILIVPVLFAHANFKITLSHPKYL